MAVWLAMGAVWLISALLTRAALPVLSMYGLVDQPNARSSHHRPTVRGGGLVAVVIILSGVLLAPVIGWAIPLELWVAILGGGGLVAVVSLIDDAGGLSAKLRLTAHFAASALAIAAVGWSWIFDPIDFVVALVCSVAIVWSINLYNFMDGIDGLAAVQAVCAGGILISIAILGDDYGRAVAPALVSAAFAGFAIWNLPPARVFMGDVGSAFLGFVFAVIVLDGAVAGLWPIWIYPIVLAFFFTDATTTLILRLARGHPATEAHRDHAYQRLARRLGKHAPVTWGIALYCVVLCGPLALFAVQFPGLGAAWASAAIMPVVGVVVATDRYHK